jgi:hypothetical protein
MVPAPDSPSTTVTLRALDGDPLGDAMVLRTVVAAAHAIAERNAVTIERLETGPGHVTATVGVSRLAAIGFAAELRRVTTEWYRHKTGRDHLWGEPRSEGEDEDDPYGLFGGSDDA